MVLYPTTVFVMGGINGWGDQEVINFENQCDKII